MIIRLQITWLGWCSLGLQSYSCTCSTRHATAPLRPQVEVKLRLNDKEAHDKLVDLLKADVQKTWQQENFYFDGSAGELSSQRVMLRCRFYNNDEKAIVTLKVRNF